MAFKMSPIGKKKCSYSPMQNKGLIKGSPVMANGNTVSSTGEENTTTSSAQLKDKPSGSFMSYNSNTNTFSTGEGQLIKDISSGSADLEIMNKRLYPANHLVTKNADGKVVKRQNAANFMNDLGGGMRKLSKARKEHGNTYRPFNRPDIASGATAIGGFNVVPGGPDYDTDQNYMANLQNMRFSQPQFNAQGEEEQGSIRSWSELSQGEKDRLLKARRQLVDNEFYNTPAMDNFRKRFPNVNNRAEYDSQRGLLIN